MDLTVCYLLARGHANILQGNNPERDHSHYGTHGSVTKQRVTDSTFWLLGVFWLQAVLRPWRRDQLKQLSVSIIISNTEESLPEWHRFLRVRLKFRPSLICIM